MTRNVLHVVHLHTFIYSVEGALFPQNLMPRESCVYASLFTLGPINFYTSTKKHKPNKQKQQKKKKKEQTSEDEYAVLIET